MCCLYWDRLSSGSQRLLENCEKTRPILGGWLVATLGFLFASAYDWTKTGPSPGPVPEHCGKTSNLRFTRCYLWPVSLEFCGLQRDKQQKSVLNSPLVQCATNFTSNHKKHRRNRLMTMSVLHASQKNAAPIQQRRRDRGLDCELLL